MRGVMVILLALMLTGRAWAAIDTGSLRMRPRAGLPRDHLPTTLP